MNNGAKDTRIFKMPPITELEFRYYVMKEWLNEKGIHLDQTLRDFLISKGITPGEIRGLEKR